MMRLRRARERHCLHSGGQNLWLSFFPSRPGDPLANGFSSLMSLNEGFLEPDGNMLTYSRRGSRTLTYVIEGVMSQKNQSRTPRLISAGEFQCSSAAFSDCSIHSNASRRESLHVMQLSLFANQPGRAPEPQQKIFPAPSRAGRLCLVASADGRDDSLTLGQDVRVYSGILDATQTSAYSLVEGRVAWLQVLRGALSIGPVRLEAGDGAGFGSSAELLLRASTDVEFVLLDLSAQAAPATRSLGPPRADWAGARGAGLAAAASANGAHHALI
jgi:redox-sensitive bicupin YhaK (pirin superfamily)